MGPIAMSSVFRGVKWGVGISPVEGLDGVYIQPSLNTTSHPFISWGFRDWSFLPHGTELQHARRYGHPSIQSYDWVLKDMDGALKSRAAT